MIAASHGLKTDLADLRRRFSISLKGATLEHLIRHSEALGLAARPLRLELEELGGLALPCILHWDLNHFVVLKRVQRDRVVIHARHYGGGRRLDWSSARYSRKWRLVVVGIGIGRVRIRLTRTSELHRKL